MQKRSIVLSDELISRIEEYAIEERRKFSPTVAILIEKALKEIERNRNRKRGTGSRKFTPNQGFKEVNLLKSGMTKDEVMQMRHFPENKFLINVHDDSGNISKGYGDHVEAAIKAIEKKIQTR